MFWQSLHLSSSLSRESSPPSRSGDSYSDLERSVSPDLRYRRPFRRNYDSDYADHQFGLIYPSESRLRERSSYSTDRQRHHYERERSGRLARDMDQGGSYSELDFDRRRNYPNENSRDREWSADYRRYFSPSNDQMRSSSRRYPNSGIPDSYRRNYGDDSFDMPYRARSNVSVFFFNIIL